MLTGDSIDPSVKDFFPLINSMDHQSQNSYQADDHRSIGSYSTDGIDPVPDHGRPNISGPIRSIKMYSWAQCTVQGRLVCSGDVPCVAQEEQGFGPSPP
jgi:hypothetical protein